MRALFTSFLWFFALAFFILLAVLYYNGNFSGAKPPSTSVGIEMPPTPSSNAAKIEAPSPSTKIEAPPTPPSNAVISGTYGDWQMRCETTSTTTGDQCFLTQSVIAKDRPNVGLVIIAGHVGPEKIEILRVVAPLGVLLPMGLGIRIDDQVIGAMDFVRCSPVACIAEARMSNNDLLKKLKNGKNASFAIFLTPEEGIGIPVSLNGFATGYDQLK